MTQPVEGLRVKRTEEGWTWRTCFVDDEKRGNGQRSDASRRGRRAGLTAFSLTLLYVPSPSTQRAAFLKYPVTERREETKSRGRDQLDLLRRKKRRMDKTHRGTSSTALDLPRSSLSEQAVSQSEVGTFSVAVESRLLERGP